MPRRTRLPALGSRLWAFGPGALSGVSLPLLPVLPVLLVKCGRKVVHGEPGTDVRTASNDRRAPGGWTGPGVYRSAEGQAAVEGLYRAVLQRWPVPFLGDRVRRRSVDAIG